MIAVKYQVFFFDPKADRRDQIVAIEPAFNSPGAIEALIKTTRFEGKDHLVLIGSQPQIDTLMKKIERLDITDWLDAPINQRKQSITDMAKEIQMSVYEHNKETLVLGDDPISVTAAKKVPYPVDLPFGHEVIWDDIQNDPKFGPRLKELKDRIQQRALLEIIYEDVCRKVNVRDWEFASQRKLGLKAKSIAVEIENKELESNKRISWIEDHLIDQGFIEKGGAKSPKWEFQLSTTHGHFEIIHRVLWKLDPAKHTWPQIRDFITRNLGSKYAFRATSNGLLNSVELSTRTYAQIFTQSLVPTTIEIIPQTKEEILVLVTQIVTKHQAAMVTQEESEADIHKAMLSFISQWYKSGGSGAKAKARKFPEPPVVVPVKF